MFLLFYGVTGGGGGKPPYDSDVPRIARSLVQGEFPEHLITFTSSRQKWE